MNKALISLIAIFAATFTTLTFAQENVEPVYIDVRTWMEHQADHIPGDTRIHVSEIVEGVSELFPDKSTPIYLYCAAGGRAESAVEQLSEAGYTNVHNAGGIEDVRQSRTDEDLFE